MVLYDHNSIPIFSVDRIITILPGAVELEGEIDIFFTAGAGERKQ